MKEEILDQIKDDDTRNSNNKLLRFIPIILLWIGIVWSLIIGGFSNNEYVIGLILLFFTSVLFFKNASEFIIMSLTMMMLGTFGLISFFPYEIFFEFGIKIEDEGIHLGIDLLLVIIGVLFILLNRQEIQIRYNEIQK